jgi:hypothetical protein
LGQGDHRADESVREVPQLINAPGSETGPGSQLVTWGKSTILSVDAHAFKFEYTLNSAKHIPFDWVGPWPIERPCAGTVSSEWIADLRRSRRGRLVAASHGGSRQTDARDRPSIFVLQREQNPRWRPHNGLSRPALRVLRQIVGNFVPWCLISNKGVGRRSYFWIFVKRGKRDAVPRRRLGIALRNRGSSTEFIYNGRAADATEASENTGVDS